MNGAVRDVRIFPTPISMDTSNSKPESNTQY